MPVLAEQQCLDCVFPRQHLACIHEASQAGGVGADVCLCGPVLTEVLRGVRGETEHREIAAAFDSFDYVEVDKATWRYASQIYRHCRAKGLTIRSTVNCTIAALALQHGLEVLHDDRDYDAIARFFPLRVF